MKQKYTWYGWEDGIQFPEDKDEEEDADDDDEEG